LNPHVWSIHEGAVYALLQTPDYVFAAGAGKAVSIYDKLGGTLLPLTIRLPHSVYSLGFSEGDNRLLVGNSAGGIHVVNLSTRSEERLLQFHRAGIYDLCKAGNRWASAGGDGRLCLIDATHLELVGIVSVSKNKLRRLLYLPHLEAVAVAGSGGGIYLVSSTNGKVLSYFEGHHGGVYSLCLHPNGTLLMSGGKDGYVRFWDMHSDFKEIMALPIHKGSVYDISVFGERIATAGRDKALKIWTPDFKLIAKIEPRNGGHTHSVNRCLWLDASRLLSAGDDRKVIGIQA
jgi:WD40 repeat protein